jgi:hypothetical protein
LPPFFFLILGKAFLRFGGKAFLPSSSSWQKALKEIMSVLIQVFMETDTAGDIWA